MKENLTIKALKYISERNGEYKFVELKNFLLNNFEDKPDFIDRYDIKSFLGFLSLSEFIKTDTTNGIDFLVISGRKIPREEISAKVKITSKGFDLLREHNKSRINNVSILINVFFWFFNYYFCDLGVVSKQHAGKCEVRHPISKR